MPTLSRFDCNSPQHEFYPAITDWHIYDYGERISPDRLVIEANKLQRELSQLKEKMKMIVYLTDGDTILLTHQVRNEEEIQQLNQHTIDSTDGELWWETAVPRPKLPHEKYLEDNHGRTIQQ